jgi:carbamoyl-phosphate synthase small subunit
MNTTTLLLDDGTLFEGTGFGAPAPRVSELGTIRSANAPKAAGEVVFNTAMSGYHEVLTDPSYTGQLVAMTYPHIGNYGCDPEWSEIGPENEHEGPGVKPGAFIVRRVYNGPVPEGRISLDQFLRENDTPGISGIDTRALTLKLRDEGSRNGILFQPAGESASSDEITAAGAVLEAFPAMVGRDLVIEVGSRAIVSINEAGSPHIALYDCGIKANIIRELIRHNCRISVIPSDFSADQLDRVGADALFVSNGPGDPAVLSHQIELIRASIGRRPVLGICLGHQLIAEALGAETYKMKFGHHGVNHPVRDEITKRVFVTSQNHGFAVDEKSLPAGCDVWFRNANDKSIEGLVMQEKRILTTQFHPESAPGPFDSHWIFDSFLDVVRD